ncbi:MAG: hypothetical protein NWQ30_08535, partial [Alishewanella sp.]|nr:hypothetical protein [Alishewanella sp.]
VSRSVGTLPSHSVFHGEIVNLDKEIVTAGAGDVWCAEFALHIANSIFVQHKKYQFCRPSSLSAMLARRLKTIVQRCIIV